MTVVPHKLHVCWDECCGGRRDAGRGTHTQLYHARSEASKYALLLQAFGTLLCSPEPRRAVLQLCPTSHSCWELLEDVSIPGARLYLPWQGGKHRCLCLFLAILLGTHVCCAFLRVLWHTERTIVWKKNNNDENSHEAALCQGTVHRP